MRHRDVRINKVNDLITKLKDKWKPNSLVWFRGQSDCNWKLIPSIGRDDRLREAEAVLAKRFKQNALAYVSQRPASEWEWMFLMQHYRVPTRLLDWTESPLAALYFAVGGEPKVDGALWCLDPVSLNSKANVSFEFDREVPAFDHDEMLDSYLPSRVMGERVSDLLPIAAIASRNSPRIQAQQGVFTITHRNHTPLESVASGQCVWRLIIPKESKPVIRKELEVLGYSEVMLFPELDSVARETLRLVQ